MKGPCLVVSDSLFRHYSTSPGRIEERKYKEQNCDLTSCHLATLVNLSGYVSNLVGQGNA